MNLYQLALLEEIPAAPVVTETELKIIAFCPICQRLGVAGYKSGNWCAECKNQKSRLLEQWFPELIRYRILPQEDKAYLKPWDIRALWMASGYRCLKCKRDFRDDLTHLHLDHVVPRVNGGPTNLTNIQLLCQRDNSRKQASKDWQRWDFRPAGWLDQLAAARNQLRNWTVGGRSFEEMLRELVRE